MLLDKQELELLKLCAAMLIYNLIKKLSVLNRIKK